MRCERCFLPWPFRASFSALVFLVLLPASGRTLLWPQNNEPSSKNSGEHLTTWEALSGRFSMTLEQHELTLNELGQKLRTSEASLQRLTPLYEQSLRQNESLKTYNGQIAERMRERDEDLAFAYDKLARLERLNLKLIIAVITLGSVIALAVVLKVGKLL